MLGHLVSNAGFQGGKDRAPPGRRSQAVPARSVFLSPLRSLRKTGVLQRLWNLLFQRTG